MRAKSQPVSQCCVRSSEAKEPKSSIVIHKEQPNLRDYKIITCCSQQAKPTTPKPRPKKRAEALNLIQFTSYKFNKLNLNRKFFLTFPNARRGNRNVTTTPARSQIQSTFRFNFAITINRTTPTAILYVFAPFRHCVSTIRNRFRFRECSAGWHGMNGWLDGWRWVTSHSEVQTFSLNETHNKLLNLS